MSVKMCLQLSWVKILNLSFPQLARPIEWLSAVLLIPTVSLSIYLSMFLCMCFPLPHSPISPCIFVISVPFGRKNERNIYASFHAQ